jgi:hypothetical protein
MSARGVTWALVAFGAALSLRADDSLAVEEKETIEPVFPAAKGIDVDTFDGSITVTGTDARGVRAGQGGPELKFDAFNGDIRIRNREK